MCTSEDSDQPAHPRSLIRILTVCVWNAKGTEWFHADNENSDQTGRMCRLISVIVGCPCQTVRFFTLQLIFVLRGSALIVITEGFIILLCNYVYYTQVKIKRNLWDCLSHPESMLGQKLCCRKCCSLAQLLHLWILSFHVPMSYFMWKWIFLRVNKASFFVLTRLRLSQVRQFPFDTFSFLSHIIDYFLYCKLAIKHVQTITFDSYSLENMLRFIITGSCTHK